jgi:hypothetical protein
MRASPLRHASVEHMGRLFAFVGTTAGGYVGWWAGTPVGIMTSFMLCVLGTAAGLYAGRRIARHYGG